VSKSDGDLIDVQRILASLWRGKLWIIGSTLLFTTLFIVAAYSIAPTYRASTLLIPASSEGGAGGLGAAMRSLAGTASLLGLSLGGGGRGSPDEALAVLKSREFLERFIRDNDLLSVLFRKDWDAERRSWRNPERPPTMAQAYKYLSGEILTVSEDRRNFLITLSIDWNDREQAASWANELVVRLNSEMRARALKEAGNSVVFLEAEMKKTSLLGIQTAISRIIEAQINKQMLANVTDEYALRVVERAMAPDDGDVVWPNKKVLAGLGLLLGGLVGVAAVLLMGLVRRT
jgi:uncharacterized protein involved in exopolysaccharide biosynthesis